MQDPSFIDSTAWVGIGDLLTWLWVFLAFAIVFAVNFLLAHAIIPSLVTSGHVPKRLDKLRPILYVTGLVSLGTAIVFLALASGAAKVIADIYERWWI